MADALETRQEKKHFTYADYKGWELAPDERYELIHGEACAMAGPTDKHQAVSGELFRQIANFLQGKPCKVRPAPYDVRLFYEDDEHDDTVVQPDISVICDEKKRGNEGCRGAPDFVLEILSPSNTATEMVRKLDLYREAGVREYWVVDPETRVIHSHIFQPDGGISTRVLGCEGKAAPLIFEGLEIDLALVFSA
jgi:Uma2 family endonuclease